MDNLKQYLKEEEQKAFSGWDFSYLEGKVYEDSLPWNYEKIVKDYLKETDLLLDVGTGGGEKLLLFKHNPLFTTVTEGYDANINLCKERLEPLGIKIIPLEGDKPLPIENDYFDIVINRHESYNIKEVNRILKKGGYFITEQVGAYNNNDLALFFNPNYKSQYPNIMLSNLLNELKENNFMIESSNEVIGKTHFLDIGSLVYYANIIKWEFPNFSVDNCYEKLMGLNKRIINEKEVTSDCHRFMAVAKKK